MKNFCISITFELIASKATLPFNTTNYQNFRIGSRFKNLIDNLFTYCNVNIYSTFICTFIIKFVFRSRKISKMKRTMSKILLGCMVFISLGSQSCDGKSNNRQSDVEQNVETRNGKTWLDLNSHLVTSAYSFVPLIQILIFSTSEGCKPKDSDACLQASPAWSRSYTCSNSIRYCFSYVKDMRRCCPESCGVGTGVFTEDECNAVDGPGVCTYPNEAQCPNTSAKREYPNVP